MLQERDVDQKFVEIRRSHKRNDCRAVYFLNFAEGGLGWEAINTTCHLDGF